MSALFPGGMRRRRTGGRIWSEAGLMGGVGGKRGPTSLSEGPRPHSEKNMSASVCFKDEFRTCPRSPSWSRATVVVKRSQKGQGQLAILEARYGQSARGCVSLPLFFDGVGGVVGLVD